MFGLFGSLGLRFAGLMLVESLAVEVPAGRSAPVSPRIVASVFFPLVRTLSSPLPGPNRATVIRSFIMLFHFGYPPSNFRERFCSPQQILIGRQMRHGHFRLALLNQQRERLKIRSDLSNARRARSTS